MTLFRLDASLRVEGSVSRAVADSVESAWRENRPDAEVVRRDIGIAPLPSTAWGAAVSAGQVAPEDRSPEQIYAVALAKRVADEILAADALLIATPLYNYGVQPNLKSWIDLAVTDPRLASGVERPLDGRPLVLVVAKGGGYGEGTPREGWDHATPYLRRIFADVWGAEVHLVEAELTLADVVPAMEALRPLAADLRAAAHETAATHGRTVAARSSQRVGAA